MKYGVFVLVTISTLILSGCSSSTSVGVDDKDILLMQYQECLAAREQVIEMANDKLSEAQSIVQNGDYFQGGPSESEYDNVMYSISDPLGHAIDYLSENEEKCEGLE